MFKSIQNKKHSSHKRKGPLILEIKSFNKEIFFVPIVFKLFYAPKKSDSKLNFIQNYFS